MPDALIIHLSSFDCFQDTQLKTSSRASSTEEVSETIPEEEEHAEQATAAEEDEEIKAVTPEDNDKGDSDSSLPDSPVLEASGGLPDKSPIFREVAVTGGE